MPNFYHGVATVQSRWIRNVSVDEPVFVRA